MAYEEKNGALMGFTPHPYDFTSEAFEKTYKFINNNGNIVSHHLDEGVPWLEFKNSNSPNNLSPNILNDIKRRKSQTKNYQKIFLSLSPLALDRQSVAGIWGDDSHMQLTDEFSSLSLNHPTILQSYLNYCEFMIRYFEPEYFAYAIEVSTLAKDDKSAEVFLEFGKYIYSNLKAKHPNIKIFPTFVLGDEKSLSQKERGFIRKLMPYADIMAVSTYPYVWDGIGGNVKNIPDNWFSKLDEIRGKKPLAVSETGFISKDYRYLRKLVWISSDEEQQYQYLKWLFLQSREQNMEFLIWYVPIDYDLLWKKMSKQGMDYWFAQWMSSGLLDTNLQPKRALDLWKTQLMILNGK